MSSIITAGRFLVDSRDPNVRKYCFDSWRILSEVIQNLSNGYYIRASSEYVHYLDLRDNTQLKIGTIVGISLGDGREILNDKRAILDRIEPLPGKIGIVYELQYQQKSIDITRVIGISRESILKTMQDSSINPMTLVTPKSTTRTSHTPQGVYA